MKKSYSFFAIMAIVLFSASLSYAAPVKVKTMTLDPGITETGYVRVVVKLTDLFAGKDIGIVLHEDEAAASWNDGIGLFGFFLGAPAPGDGSVPQAMGYNGADGGAWNTEKVVDLEKNKEIAIWFKIDIANETHGLSVQMEGTTEVTEVYSDFISRASAKDKLRSNAKYCTVFYNDAGGLNSDGCVEIIKDAEIVEAIEPYFGNTTHSNILKKDGDIVKVFPTLVENTLNISSKETIKCVKVLSITGQQVLSFNSTEQISLSELNNGYYFVEVETLNNNISRQRILKK